MTKVRLPEFSIAYLEAKNRLRGYEAANRIIPIIRFTQLKPFFRDSKNLNSILSNVLHLTKHACQQPMHATFF